MSLEKLGFEHIVRRLGILNYIGNGAIAGLTVSDMFNALFSD